MKINLLRLLLPALFALSLLTVRAQNVPIDQYVYDQIHTYTTCATMDSATQLCYLDTICAATAHIPYLYLSYPGNAERYLPHVDTMMVDFSIGYIPPYLRWLKIRQGYPVVQLPDSLRGLEADYSSALPPLPPYLEYLSCVYTDATSLPVLPASLRYLDCYAARYLDSLPALPAGLTYLDCSYITNLQALPQTLPTALIHLDCAGIGSGLMQRIQLPPLPSGLRYLNCAQMDSLLALPMLPATLDTLICYRSQVTTFNMPPALVYLSCPINTITTMPALPSTLTYLDCGGNPISTMPALPPGLQYLDCNNNFLSALPTLPATLTYLDCHGNTMPSIPALPSGLVHLSCGSSPMPLIPTLPSTLLYLDCSFDSLASMPVLPLGLQELHMAFCQQHTLPALPAGLQVLDCEGNAIHALPTLPATLVRLSCSNDSLTALPALPSQLTDLYASFNQIVHLPYLPGSLRRMSCTDDWQLLDLTNIPERVETFFLYNDVLLSCLPAFSIAPGVSLNMSVSNTNIQCTPSLTPYLGLPLCTPGSGCPFSYNIQGRVHLDTAATCTADSLRPGHMLGNIKVLLKKNGAVQQQMYTQPWGDYAFRVDSMTSYEVAIDSTQYPLLPACPAGGVRTVPLTATDTLAFGQDFGLRCSGAEDYRPLSIIGTFRPGAVRTVTIAAGSLTALTYGADCGTSQPGVVTTTYSGLVSYVGPAAGAMTPSAVSGHTLTYSIPDISTLYPWSFGIVVATDSTADMDSTVCITVIIKSATPDIRVYDDTLAVCNTIRNSFDPNHKDVYPAIASPEGGWLTYTIHFQNTGNDTAYTVVLRDTLSSLVRPETFEYMASSHPAVVQLDGRAMTFTFAKINLVDSATNPPLSEGWIQYRVKSRPALPLQTQIPNTAYIFFDLNAPIVTNTAVATVDTTAQGPSGIRSIAHSAAISLYPNPNTGIFTLQSAGAQAGEYTVTDMLGNVIQQRTVTSTLQPIDLREAAPGIYTIAVKGAAPLRFTIVK